MNIKEINPQIYCLYIFNKFVYFSFRATAFTFEEKRKKGQKEYQEKVRVREQP